MIKLKITKHALLAVRFAMCWKACLRFGLMAIKWATPLIIIFNYTTDRLKKLHMLKTVRVD